MPQSDIFVEDENRKEYVVSINFRDMDTIFEVFTQIGYDIDKYPIYNKLKNYVGVVTTNYLNPQNAQPVDSI
jgi:hypothetical protein